MWVTVAEGKLNLKEKNADGRFCNGTLLKWDMPQGRYRKIDKELASVSHTAFPVLFHHLPVLFVGSCGSADPSSTLPSRHHRVWETVIRNKFLSHSLALGPHSPFCLWPEMPGMVSCSCLSELYCCFNWPQFSASVMKTLKTHTRVIFPAFFYCELFSPRGTLLAIRPTPAGVLLGFLSSESSRLVNFCRLTDWVTPWGMLNPVLSCRMSLPKVLMLQGLLWGFTCVYWFTGTLKLSPHSRW